MHVRACSTSCNACSRSDESASEAIRDFLSKKDVAQDIIGRVCYVVEHISYSKEIKGEKLPCPYGDSGEEELKCVQDADRLDAIGAIGIAR
jgi:hypothetical protein